MIPLHKRTGHQFNDPDLELLALTHRSVHGTRNNERLEFIGDAILGQIIALDLYYRFPDAKEGQLSRLRSSVVKGETLSEVAHELGLGDYLKLGPGELKSGGFRRKSILADALEALIGAIYLDSDLQCTQQVMQPWFLSRLEMLNPDVSLKDAKSRLQEWLQARTLPLPVYEVIEQSGPPHDQSFVVRVEVATLSKGCEGRSNSRRGAEQAVAEIALKLLGLEKE